MPILYVHGVNTRSRDGFLAMQGFLRRYVAPAIADDPDAVLIDDAYWGEAGVDFAWGGLCRPRSRLLGQGADATTISDLQGALTAASLADALGRMPELPPDTRTPSGTSGGLVASGSTTSLAASTAGRAVPTLRLHRLLPAELSDLLAVTIAGDTAAPTAEQTRLILAADDVAQDPTTAAALASAATPEDELALLLDRVRARADESSAETLRGMGAGGFWTRLGDRLRETADRALGLPAYAASVAAAELRGPLNDLVSVFAGDVLVYLADRGKADQPGRIPDILLDRLAAAHANKQARHGEPLVVLTHSMGGQLIYDALTHFLPSTPALRGIRVDFWCATASQVGFFEEAKLFLASDKSIRKPDRVPFPGDHLGVWWNVWDHNDVISFTAQDIFDGVRDGPYDTGLSLASAHGGYLTRPSFYRRLRRGARDGQGGRLAHARPMSLQPVDDTPGLWADPHWRPGHPGTFALVIGVSRYPHLDGGGAEADDLGQGWVREARQLGQLTVSATTAWRFFSWLADGYRFRSAPIARCWLLLAPTPLEQAREPALRRHAAEPTLANVEQALLSWAATLRRLPAAAQHGSRALFFFSGHGLQVHSQNQLLLPMDYLGGELPNWDNALSTFNLLAGLDAVEVPDRLYFVDACRNDFPAIRAKRPRGRSILPEDETAASYPATRVSAMLHATAASLQAWSPVDPSEGLSLFGQALLAGLAGQPDIELTERDGYYAVELAKLQGFAKERVAQILKPSERAVSQEVEFSAARLIDAKTPVTEIPPSGAGRHPARAGAGTGPGHARRDARSAGVPGFIGALGRQPRRRARAAADQDAEREPQDAGPGRSGFGWRGPRPGRPDAG